MIMKINHLHLDIEYFTFFISFLQCTLQLMNNNEDHSMSTVFLPVAKFQEIQDGLIINIYKDFFDNL